MLHSIFHTLQSRSIQLYSLRTEGLVFVIPILHPRGLRRGLDDDGRVIEGDPERVEEDYKGDADELEGRVGIAAEGEH